MFDLFKKPEVKEPFFREDIESDWMEEPKPKPKRRKRRAYRSRQATNNSVLVFLAGRQGRITSYGQISRHLGFSNPNAVSKHILELIAKKAIRRSGHQGAYTYTVLRTRVNGKRGATAKAVRQTKPQQVETPVEKTLPLTSKQRRVLRYIESRNERPVSYKDISQALHIGEAGVWRYIKILCDRGFLLRSGSTYDGTRYRVVGESTTVRTEEPSPNRETQSEDQSSSDNQNEKAFVENLDSLVWEFLRQTRSTDVLVFLTWMEQKVK
jgi:biotin operon repressor